MYPPSLRIIFIESSLLTLSAGSGALQVTCAPTDDRFVLDRVERGDVGRDEALRAEHHLPEQGSAVRDAAQEWGCPTVGQGCQLSIEARLSGWSSSHDLHHSITISVTSKKLPIDYKSYPKMILPEKLKILTPWQKLHKNVGDLGKLIVAKGFEKFPKVQWIAQSGHTDHNALFQRGVVTTIINYFLKFPQKPMS